MGFNSKYQKAGVVLSIIIGIIAIYLQINPPQSPQAKAISNLFFFAILTLIILYFIMDWFAYKINSYIKKINDTYNDVQDIKKILGLKKKGKKGQIDPRIIILIILIILLYLYLRSIGYIK